MEINSARERLGFSTGCFMFEKEVYKCKQFGSDFFHYHD